MRPSRKSRPKTSGSNQGPSVAVPSTPVRPTADVAPSTRRSSRRKAAWSCAARARARPGMSTACTAWKRKSGTRAITKAARNRPATSLCGASACSATIAALATACAQSADTSSQPRLAETSAHLDGGPWRSADPAAGRIPGSVHSSAARGATPSTQAYGPTTFTPVPSSAMAAAVRITPSTPSCAEYQPKRPEPENIPRDRNWAAMAARASARAKTGVYRPSKTKEEHVPSSRSSTASVTPADAAARRQTGRAPSPRCALAATARPSSCSKGRKAPLPNV